MSLQGKGQTLNNFDCRAKKIMSNRIDKIKLNHWLNIRKTTVDVLNDMLSKHLNFSLSFDNLDKLDEHAIEKIAEVLSIPKNNIIKNEEVPAFVFNSKKQIEKTKRPIRRGGIHYYNYYLTYLI